VIEVPVRTEDFTFWSGPGIRMAGRVYLPAGDDGRPGAGVVFCHGFGGVKEGTPVGLSALLAERGYRVLSFDYRGFGGSGGAPGRLVPAEQVEDAAHALEYLAQRADVDPRRIGIYGTSFGGGIALMASARSERVRACVVTVPVTSGSHWLQSITRWHEYHDLKRRAMEAIAKKTVTGQMEMVDRFDIMVPDPITRARYTEKVSLTLETVYHVLHHEPIAEAGRVRIPVLVIGVQDDRLAPVEQATMLYERLAGPKQLHLFTEGGHFSVYDELLAGVAERTIAWFDQHLAGDGSRSG